MYVFMEWQCTWWASLCHPVAMEFVQCKPSGSVISLAPFSHLGKGKIEHLWFVFLIETVPNSQTQMCGSSTRQHSLCSTVVHHLHMAPAPHCSQEQQQVCLGLVPMVPSTKQNHQRPQKNRPLFNISSSTSRPPHQPILDLYTVNSKSWWS